MYFLFYTNSFPCNTLINSLNGDLNRKVNLKYGHLAI